MGMGYIIVKSLEKEEMQMEVGVVLMKIRWSRRSKDI